MEAIQLVVPAEEHLAQVANYRREMMKAGSSMDGTSALHQYDGMAAWLEDVRRCACPDTVIAGWVQSTQFLALRESDGGLVGMIQVRHRFNDYLERYGGHIGYSVRPCERRRGYAREMLRLALPYCKGIGLDRVLVTCDSDNSASRRTILANGGAYESTVREPEEGMDVERYWIAAG